MPKCKPVALNCFQDVNDYNERVFGVKHESNGIIVKLHEIGDISIMEYYPLKEDDAAQILEVDYSATVFAVRGEGAYCKSLDEALLFALDSKYNYNEKAVARLEKSMAQPCARWQKIQERVAATGGMRTVSCLIGKHGNSDIEDYGMHIPCTGCYSEPCICDQLEAHARESEKGHCARCNCCPCICGNPAAEPYLGRDNK